MTERESGDDRDYPDGSVGRYVREQWGAVPPSRATRPYVGPVTPVPEPAETDGEPDPDDAEIEAETPRVAENGWPGNGHVAAAVPPLQAPPARPMRVVPPAQQGWTPPPGTGPVPIGAPPPGQPWSRAAVPPPASPPSADSTPRGTARWTDPAAVAAQEAQHARSGADRPSADLSSARLLRPAKRPPQSGWRRFVYVITGRLVNPGESPSDVRRRELTVRVNQPLLGCYKIAMLSLKGGVGKTTVTATLGATFASLRGDRVVAVDANPDRGTLSQKIPLETSATVRNLLRDAQRVRRYTDVRAYTSQGPSRLEVLASEQDPAVSEAFSEDDYRRTVNLLEHFYNIVLTDCGTGLMHSAMYGVLGVADQLIIVSSGSIDGARSASATMDWLEAHGHGDLVANSVAVINCVHRSAGGVDLDRVAEHFDARCRTVVRIPFDAHLEEGAEVDLERLEPGTRLALLELAAAVADAFEGAPTG
jgi:MinD-like ATPase involved in chromosome partitioning or flagellar assembly